MANGCIIVDKPRGPTSFDVVAHVRRAAHERRVGHAGTLDPMATGVLPVCLGDATKLVPFLMGGHKEYEAEARLGITTDTLDATGEVVDTRDAAHVTQSECAEALAAFRGKILQTPPMHSAIRKDGQRLYDLARKGVEVEREPREIEILDIELLSFSDATLRFRVLCGKGTYIRSLAADLGARLGVGAHLSALRRTRVGRFTLADAIPMPLPSPPPLMSPAEALADLPTLALDDADARDVRDGKLTTMARLRPPEGTGGHIRLLRPDGALLAVAAHQDGNLTLMRVFR